MHAPGRGPAMPSDAVTDEARMRAIFREHYASLVRFAARRTVGHEVDDVVAETFLVAWRRLDELPTDREELRAWLYGVARNCLANRARSARRRDAVAVRLADAGELAQHEDATERVDLTRAWLRLGDRDRETLAMLAWDGLDHAQAARVLGISRTAFGVRVSRARRRLIKLADPDTGLAGGDPR